MSSPSGSNALNVPGGGAGQAGGSSGSRRSSFEPGSAEAYRHHQRQIDRMALALDLDDDSGADFHDAENDDEDDEDYEQDEEGDDDIWMDVEDEEGGYGGGIFGDMGDYDDEGGEIDLFGELGGADEDEEAEAEAEGAEAEEEEPATAGDTTASNALALLLQRVGMNGLRQLIASGALRIVDSNNNGVTVSIGGVGAGARRGGGAADDDDADSDDSDGGYWWLSNGGRMDRKMSDRWERIAHGLAPGQQLRWSGEFGRVSRKVAEQRYRSELEDPRSPQRSPAFDRAKAQEWQGSAFEPCCNLSSRIVSRRTLASPSLGYASSASSQSYGISKEDLAAYIPNHEGVEVARFPASPVYTAAYSPDGAFYYSACRDFTIQLYDMTKAPSRTVQSFAAPGTGMRRVRGGMMMPDDDEDLIHTSLHRLKSLRGRVGGWTVTDADLSPDNKWMIYATASSAVTLIPTGHGEEEPAEALTEEDKAARDQQQVVLDFSAPRERSRRRVVDGWDSAPIWALKFSGDSREIVASAKGGEVIVYDIEARRRVLGIDAHNDDVNAVCFADNNSQNMLVSGSDDTFVKVWDRRSLAGGKAAGWLPGHTEGVTYVCPKGDWDGKYLISNGKDQAVRLWDLRMMMSGGSVDQTTNYGIPNYDYRTTRYPRPRYLQHGQDVSVMAYRGHAVLYTLIRCRFSPPSNTGQQYIYSGSADGRIHIWSLDGQTVQVLDRAKARPIFSGANATVARGGSRMTGSSALSSAEPSAPDPSAPVSASERSLLDSGSRTNYCVRDVSWSPAEPAIMSASWEGGRGTYGSIVRHEWKGYQKNGLNDLADWTERWRNELTC